LPLGPGVEILQADPRGLVCLNKPAGVLSHPNSAGDRERSLLTAEYVADEEHYRLPVAPGQPERSVWLLNRLDSATSGAILVATRAEVAAAIRLLFERRLIRKTYAALVFGHLRQSQETWRDRMRVERGEGRGVRAGEGGGLEAETLVRRLVQVPGPPALTLLSLEPKTGRTHQLRFQCSRRGIPIVGDANYGDFGRNREFTRRAGTKRLFLHSWRLSLAYELSGRRFDFAAEAPLPAEFPQLRKV
jgi:tRNA pseudouridine65 synthase